MDEEEIGVTLAIQDAIRALVKTHHDMDVIARQMLLEREETIALLLGKSCPDSTIEAYRDIMDSMRPHADGANMNPP